MSETHLILLLTVTEVGSSCSQKHLGLLLGERLNFNEIIQKKMSKCCKTIGVIKRLSLNLHLMHYQELLSHLLSRGYAVKYFFQTIS